MRNLLLIIIFLACKLSVFASHIVGGEFELLHLQDFQYRLNMLLYFDELNGSAGARDQQVVVYFYRKSDNTLIFSRTLSIANDEAVEYSNPACDPNNSTLSTSRIIYTTTLTLSEEEFSNPEGYYVSWERCCRNYTITNIFSDEPNTGGVSAGQTFYLEFPPVTKNGEPFINSTPRLFPPLRDFACINKLYFADFGGVDDDGDSLVYTLTTPYSTVDTQNAFPASPNSGPYPEIVWRDGFNVDGVVNGSPDLAITRRGILTVTPQFTGLYVFAVKVEEFRDGVKHGEMRRDFQMLVIADCGNNGDPSVFARETGNSEFYAEGSVLNFNVEDENKCIDILVTDRLTGEGRDTLSNVSVRAIPLNFDADLEDIEIDFNKNVTIENELDTARFTVCFPNCPFTRSGFYQIGIIGFDDACPQPSLDTVVVSLNVPPPPNQNAFFRVNNAVTSNARTLVANNPDVNSFTTWNLGSFDNDGDSVNLLIEPLGFDPTLAGITIGDISYATGQALTTISWSTDCLDEALDFSKGRDVVTSTGVSKAFDFMITAEDFDQCEWEDPQQLRLTLLVNFPRQTKPTIFESSRQGQEYLQLNYLYGQTVSLNIRGQDQDGDNVRLTGQGANFNFNELGITFESVEGLGSQGVNSPFLWEIPCVFDAELDSLRIQFFIEDIDDCQLTNIDTLDVDLMLAPPVNNPPDIFIATLSDVNIVNDSISVEVNTLIELNVRGIDADGDTIILDLLERSPDDPFEFEGAVAPGIVQSPFVWTPTCQDLTGPDITRDLDLTFIARDTDCYDPLGSSYSLKIHVVDLNAGEENILPPNFFSPNGDGVNEYFGMYKKDPVTNAVENILPTDNCAGQFERVIIFNRWGRSVFESDDRNFKWFGEDAAAGVYFYQVQFSNREYTGSVSILY